MCQFEILLESAQRVDAAEKIELINIAQLANSNIKKGAAGELISKYQRITNGPEDIDKSRVSRDRELLRKKLQGKMI